MKPLHPLIPIFLPGVLALGSNHLPARAEDGPVPRLRLASLRFGITPAPGGQTDSQVGAKVTEVCGPLKTTVTLLDDGRQRLCLIATDFFVPFQANVSDLVRRTVAADLGLPVARVLLFSSHNHSAVSLASNGDSACLFESGQWDTPNLLPVGEEFVSELHASALRLPGLLQPVTVWWAEGHEDRITYNRKGRRADGSTYFMREPDRLLLGADYTGDIDTQAPVVVFKNVAGQPIAAFIQFTGHPVTSYHAEKPVVFGGYPQVAADMLARHLAGPDEPAVSFLQGCAGDVNSKEMFRGGVARATEFGRMLGRSYIDALVTLRPSRRDGLDYAVVKARVPLGPLPPPDTLEAELAEMGAFIRRANDGDPDTLSCVGLNLPTDLTPAYRAALVERVRPWNEWALSLYKAGREASVPRHLELEVYVLRVGDVGIVGLPCEPFQGIGRRMRDKSPLPLVIPCGYTNQDYGYITDGPNTGDREYMSSYYRYTRFRPPLTPPAGDVLADAAIKALDLFARETQVHD